MQDREFIMSKFITNNGDYVLTPTLAAEGNTALGVWMAGETKEVPDDVAETLTLSGSQFSFAEDTSSDELAYHEHGTVTASPESGVGGILRSFRP
jgi:hypothetical protein